LLHGDLVAVGRHGDDSGLVRGPGIEGGFDQGVPVGVGELVELASPNIVKSGSPQVFRCLTSRMKPFSSISPRGRNGVARIG
jgi:hypothetical protein